MAVVRAKSVSALELTDAAIARIEALDRPINAVVVRDFDRARDQARQVDLAVAKGADLPLAGVPMTVKECFNVAGLPTTFGLEFAKDYRPGEDAAALRRLKDAGAVIWARPMSRQASRTTERQHHLRSRRRTHLRHAQGLDGRDPLQDPDAGKGPNRDEPPRPGLQSEGVIAILGVQPLMTAAVEMQTAWFRCGQVWPNHLPSNPDATIETLAEVIVLAADQTS